MVKSSCAWCDVRVEKSAVAKHELECIGVIEMYVEGDKSGFAVGTVGTPSRELKAEMQRALTFAVGAHRALGGVKKSPTDKQKSSGGVKKSPTDKEKVRSRAHQLPDDELLVDGLVVPFGFCEEDDEYPYNAYLEQAVGRFLHFYSGPGPSVDDAIPVIRKYLATIDPAATIPTAIMRPNVYFSWNVPSTDSQVEQLHYPPPEVAKLIRTHTTCKHHCNTCKTAGCVQCPHCCLMKHKNDKSVTVDIMFQLKKTPVKQRAVFVLGSQAFYINGGAAFVYNGNAHQHGLWLPRDFDAVGYPVERCEAVVRK